MDKIIGGVITDHFKIGDKVSWITICQTVGGVDITRFSGVIEEIKGSKSLVSCAEILEKRLWISLFELEVENEAKN